MFGIIPTCQMTTSPIYNRYQYSNLNNSNLNDSIDNDAKILNNEISVNMNSNASTLQGAPTTNSNTNKNLHGSIKYDSLLLCQITSFDEAKIYNFVTNQVDMIVNFDFYVQNGKKKKVFFLFFDVFKK